MLAWIIIPILVLAIVVTLLLVFLLPRFGFSVTDVAAFFQTSVAPAVASGGGGLIHRFSSYTLSGPWQTVPVPAMAGWMSWTSNTLSYNVSWTGLSGIAAVALVVRPRAGSAPITYYTMPDANPGYHTDIPLPAPVLEAWLNGDLLFFGAFRAPPSSSTGLLFAEVW